MSSPKHNRKKKNQRLQNRKANKAKPKSLFFKAVERINAVHTDLKRQRMREAHVRRVKRELPEFRDKYEPGDSILSVEFTIGNKKFFGYGILKKGTKVTERNVRHAVDTMFSDTFSWDFISWSDFQIYLHELGLKFPLPGNKIEFKEAKI
jgi:hypothetical protein